MIVSLCTRRFRNVLLLAFALFALAYAGEQKLKSVVSSVTVYSDRALVTRTAQDQLTAGHHTIVIADLPSGFVDESLRVAGDAEGQAKILDVKIEEIFLDTIPEGRVRQLQDRLNRLKSEEQTLLNRQIILRSQVSLVDSLRVYYVRDSKNLTGGQKTTFDEWDKMLSFVDKSLSVIYGKMLETSAKLEEVKGRIESTKEEISQSSGYSKKSVKQVRVDLEVARAGLVRLNVSYLISGSNWVPQYEARVTSEPPALQFVYLGSVSQSTGEDWHDVDLTLSTAQPSTGGTPGTLYPWIVDAGQRQAYYGGSTASMRTLAERVGQGGSVQGVVRDKGTGEVLAGANVILEGTTLGAATDPNGRFMIRNVSSGVYSVRASLIGYQSYSLGNVRTNQSSSVWIDFQLVAAQIQLSEVAVTGARLQSENVVKDIEIGQAQVQTQATSSIFKIPSKADIPSDNSPHKVGILVENLPIDFEYFSAPKLTAAAYLKGMVKNSTEFPFLGGTMNVFFENSFVATSQIKTTFPRETFDAYLGVDDGVRVERKAQNRFTEYTGTFSKKIKVTFDLVIDVQNRKNKEIKLALQDQIPVSRNEKIVVEQIEPDVKAMPADARGFLNWNLLLKSGEKKALKVKFSVEYPADFRVVGLD